MARRKRSKIDRLEPAFKETVEEMIVSNQFSYAEIAEYIQDNTGVSISRQAVCTHAKNLCLTLETVRMAQESFKAIMHEMNRYPNLDTTEGIIQMMSYHLLNYVQNLSEDDLKNADPIKLMKQASELVRVASYKKNLDLKNKELTEMGFDAVKDKVFSAMAHDNPELYKQLTDYLDRRKDTLKDGEMQ